MPFSARNARYLRISAHVVLPLYIYLDEKHVEWMRDYTLQRVLEDLRPVIGPKLRTEINLPGSGGSSAKKGTVDVHRGDTYQFAYFFRKNEPHAVLIKSRKFVLSPSTGHSTETPFVESPQLSRPMSRKRRGTESRTSSTKKLPGVPAKLTGTRGSSDTDEDEGLEEISAGITSESPRRGTTRRSLRKGALIAGGYHETEGEGDNVVMVDPDHITEELGHNATENVAGNNPPTTAYNIQHDTISPDPEPKFSPPFDVDTEDEEEKPKLSMRVTYQGFTIYDRCLCVIIEPWPTLQDRSRARSVGSSVARDSDNSTDWRERTPMVSIRERTPLFLPEFDSRRSSTPAPLPSRFVPPVPLFDHNAEDQENATDATDEDGMMAFSQVLTSIGGKRAGSADEDENEGDVFLGDADERIGDP